MTEATRMRWLRTFLRVLSVGSLAGFSSWIGLILLNAPVLAPGSSLAPLLRFQPYNASYESMLSAVYVVWAIAMWRASTNPEQHTLFIDFTTWATAAHGLVMLIATPLQKSLFMWVIEGLPLLATAAVLWWLRPKARYRGDAREPRFGGTVADGRQPEIRVMAVRSST